MTFGRHFVACFALVLVTVARADVVAINHLSRDTAKAYITDSLNNREWLGWDSTRGYSYSETLNQTGVGGLFEGYRFASNVDAQMFTDALAGVNSCSATGNPDYAVCSSMAGTGVERLVGESWLSLSQANNFDLDYVLFLSDGNALPIGILEVASYYSAGGTSSIAKQNSAWSFASADYRFSSGDQSIGWLLYRDIPLAVPEPQTALLFIVGLAVVLVARRRAQTA